ILDTVRNLSSSFGVSALYVSHDLPVVAQIADETAVMYAGRLVERNRGTALFLAPRHPYTAGLIAAAPSPDQSQHLVGIEGRPPRPGPWPVGGAFADRCGNATEQCRTTPPPWVESNGPGLRCWNPIAGASAQPPALRIVSPEESTEPPALRVAALSATYGG